MLPRAGEVLDETDAAIPLPIQTFLWRQTSPFIRPRFGGQQDATAMEQREACKSFEKVLVQNIQFGLSPPLCEAIKSISRWRLIQSALPHVMHCCAALLYNRRHNNWDKLGTAETKLLYTLHWIVLDAAEECADAEYEEGQLRPYNHYLFPISTIEVFVYLYAPLTHYLKQSDFLTSFRLENGYKIWDAIFQHRHPDIPCFTAEVKPNREVWSSNYYERKPTAKFGDVFLGASFEKDPFSSPATELTKPEKEADQIAPTSPAVATGPSPAEPRLQELQKEPQTIGSPTAAAARRGSRVGGDQESDSGSKPKSPMVGKKLKNPLMATYLDVAVVRCLFISQWIEEGIDWGLHFLIHRLDDMKVEKVAQDRPKPRSQSLPNIKQGFTDVRSRTKAYVDSEGLLGGAKTPSNQVQMHGSLQDLRRSSYGTVSLHGDIPGEARSKSKRSKKEEKKYQRSMKDKAKKSEWKKIRSALMFTSHELIGPPPPRPGSSLGIMRSEDTKLTKAISDAETSSGQSMIRGKSMPTLHIMLERRNSADQLPPPKPDTSKPIDGDESEDSSTTVTKNLTVNSPPVPPNPIITITEHSPVTSVQFFLNADNNDSGDGTTGKTVLTRSQSDRNLAYYSGDAQPEAPGSAHYISKSGQLSLLVVLKACHHVATHLRSYADRAGGPGSGSHDNATSLRVCEGLVTLIRKLLDMGLLQQYNNGNPIFAAEAAANAQRRPSSKRERQELSVNHLIIDALMYVNKHLGCTHGCSEGYHGPAADTLRRQIPELLMVLFRANETLFIRYYQQFAIEQPVQDVLDMFHAFLGFCINGPSLLSPFSLKSKQSQQPQGQSSSAGGGKGDAGSIEPRTGYATNFGNGFGKVGPRGVEGIIIEQMFKLWVSRMVRMMKELRQQESMSTFCEIRQFVNYVKDNHGGVFRKVALSALFDSALKFKEDTQAATKAAEAQQQLEMQRQAEMAAAKAGFGDDGDKASSHRKSFFRKKGSTAGLKKTPSTQSISDEYDQWPLATNAPLGLAMSHGSTPALLRISRAASPRLSITDDEAFAMQKKHSRFGFAGWFKTSTSGKHPDEPGHELGEMGERARSEDRHAGARRPSNTRHQRQPQKSTSHVSLTFMKGAKKRMEDQFSRFGFGKGKNKQNSFDDAIEMSRRNSFEFENTYRDADMLMVRESRLVSLPMIRNGMLRFSFLLEVCAPGTLPDPPLLAAMLDLQAPIAARAAFFFEVANFVHSCNRGHWPQWMKFNVPLFRPSIPGKSIVHGAGRTGALGHTLHRSAGRMFYMWAEAIGARLEDLIAKEAERASGAPVITQGSGGSVTNLEDLSKRKLRSEDEEENFLDELSTNPNGNDCPFALKMAATQVLLEITAFLRESHQYLPTRTSRCSISKPGEKGNAGYEPRAITANRRWSMALSSLGFSQTSAHSLASLADPTGGHPPAYHPGERRISFVLHEADAEQGSNHSSTTTLTQQELEGLKDADGQDPTKKKRLSQSSGVGGPPSTGSRAHLLRRATGAAIAAATISANVSGSGGTNGGGNGGGSFKRRSFKLKKGTARTKHRSSTVDEGSDDKEATAGGNLDPNAIRRAESVRARRRASGISERSDISERASGDESPGVLSDDGQPDSPTDALQADDKDIVKNLPWIRVIVGLVNSLDFECNHHHYCQPNCYQRQIRACSRLVKAIGKVYEYDGSESAVAKPGVVAATHGRHKGDEKEDVLRKEKKLKKILTGPSSPVRRKISVGHNVDHQVDRSTYPTYSLHSSATIVASGGQDIEAGTSSDKGKPLPGRAPPPPTSKATCKDDIPCYKYIKNHVKGLFHNPMSLLLKGALVLQPHVYVELLVISWELLLEEDQHLSATAAAGFIVAAVKSPEYATELLNKELSNEDPSQRIRAINKFYAIWKARYQCWPRMEEGAHAYFKVPPPSIEFTLPSPKIALDTQPVADPPWMPQSKAKVEEVTISQEQSVQKSFVTATKTRRKQQIELVHRALQQEQEKLREEREIFRISAVPITNQAAYEPALFHTTSEEHAGATEEQDDEQVAEKTAAHHIQVAQAMFPSSLCSAAVTIINLLDDPQVSQSGSAVYEVAYKVIWHCLVEDTALFLRHFFEKLTREKQKIIFQILRRLIRFMPRLPAQAAYTLYNYLIGFVMFHVRSPVEGSTELLADTLSVLWLVVPSVHGLFLKDLKQILRKEQCDASLLITANVPSAKKLIVHGPDVSGIPSQFPIHEDTQFSQILIDSLDFFSIEDNLISEYFLVDSKTNQMHNLNAFVRDFYFFKRSQYPQLSLVRMNPTEAFEKLQQQAFTLQFVELGKALMSLSIVKSNVLAIQRVLFLHEELMKLPSFPRKALEANFSLYRGLMGKEMLGMDTLHKVVWVRLVARMFEVTSSFFAQSPDIHLFINVVNGALILHCEDAAVLRLCVATYINAAHQFKNIFAINGYMLIIPTLLRIYSNHQTNALLTRTIEFICKQFYIMHRKPFLLQMFGAVAPILDTDALSAFGDATKIQPKAFFQLLQSLGQYIVDPLDILELVEVEKPLKALDFCYQMDPETVSILDSISLCVTVVAYAADSTRSKQMLMILDSIVPLYMKHMQLLTMKKETPGGPRTELQAIHNISVCIKTLVSNSEALTRNFTGPQRAIDLRGSSMKNVTKGINSPPFEVDEDSHSKFMGDSYYTPRTKQYSDDDDNEAIRDDFRRPRDILLNLVAEFLTRSTARLADLSKKVPDLHQKGSQYELLDVKCHLRLAEVAHSLLKVAPYDPQTMGCRGLLRYMNEVLPTSEWRQEQMRPALTMILRRLDKMFNKIAKKNAIKRLTDWDAAKRLLKGVYLTFIRHPYIVHLPHLKSLISVCQNIILGDPNNPLAADSTSALPSWAAALAQSPPAGFSSVAVRLVAMQMLQMGETQTLETICGGSLASPEKAEIYLMNMIYPMCIRISGGLKDVPKLRPCDITFTLSVILHSLAPPQTSKSSGKGNLSDSNTYQNPALQSGLHQIGFLGLKIMMVCFDRMLASEWSRIAQCIRDLVNRGMGGLTLWNFLDFVVTHRTPLFILLLPLIRFKLINRICDNDQEYYVQQLIKEKLSGRGMPPCRSKGQMLVSLLAELKALKEDLVNRKATSDQAAATSRLGTESNAHRLSFAITSAFQSSSSKTVTLEPICSPKGHQSSDGEPASPFDVQPGKSSLSRGFSFSSDHGKNSRLPIRGLSVKLPSRTDSNRRVVKRFLRRTSYPYKQDAESGSSTPADKSAKGSSATIAGTAQGTSTPPTTTQAGGSTPGTSSLSPTPSVLIGPPTVSILGPAGSLTPPVVPEDDETPVDDLPSC